MVDPVREDALLESTDDHYRRWVPWRQIQEVPVDAEKPAPAPTPTEEPAPAPAHIRVANQVRFLHACNDWILATVVAVDAKNRTATLQYNDENAVLPFRAILPIRENRDSRCEWLDKKVLFLPSTFNTTLVLGTVVEDFEDSSQVIVSYMGSNGKPRFGVFVYARIYAVSPEKETNNDEKPAPAPAHIRVANQVRFFDRDNNKAWILAMVKSVDVTAQKALLDYDHDETDHVWISFEWIKPVCQPPRDQPLHYKKVLFLPAKRRYALEQGTVVAMTGADGEETYAVVAHGPKTHLSMTNVPVTAIYAVLEEE